MIPTTRYAKSGDVHVAYQTFGDGPVEMVFVPGFVSHIENYWEEPSFERFLNRLGSFARVTMFDKRGTGLSDQVSDTPGMDERMDDVRAVMDAVGLEQAVLFGISEGGSLAALFAAHHPERCLGMILYGAFARFSSWFPTAESLQQLFDYIETGWGSGESLPLFAPTMADDKVLKQWWGKFERLGATPGAAAKIMKLNSEIDVSGVLPTVHTPTLIIHRTDDVAVNISGGRELAELIPNARLVELPGRDHLLAGENIHDVLDVMEEFLTGTVSAPIVDRVLATVMITDIVDSTRKATEMGDRRWQDLMEAHNAIVRAELRRFRGNEVRFTGDGFLSTFDGPARAIRCAAAVSRSVKPLGIEIRAGLHTGEVEFHEEEVHGIAVNTAARIAALAGPSEVLVSRTVKDLVAGSGTRLAPSGTHDLKGLEEPIDVFVVSS